MHDYVRPINVYKHRYIITCICITQIHYHRYMIHYHMLRIPLKGGRGPLKTSKLVTFHALPAPDEEKERVITTRLPPSPPILLKLKSRLEAFLCNLTSVNESISLFYYFSFNEWADFIGRKRESFTTGAFWSLCKHSGKSSILEPNEDIQIWNIWYRIATDSRKLLVAGFWLQILMPQSAMGKV